MVYIDRDGRVLERRPWDLKRLTELFTGLWFMMVQFFMTLTAPFKGNDNGSRDNARRSGWGSGGGGGGGGGGNGPGGGSGRGGGNDGFRPNRRIGRVVHTSMDCPGGGCGM